MCVTSYYNFGDVSIIAPMQRQWYALHMNTKMKSNYQNIFGWLLIMPEAKSHKGPAAVVNFSCWLMLKGKLSPKSLK